jgi:hypothetical protein
VLTVDSFQIMTNNAETRTYDQDEDDSKLPVDHPRKLIPELCRLFYQLGWVTGYRIIRIFF